MPGNSSQGSRVSALSRWCPPDDPRLAAARRDLRTEQLADHIRDVVESAPPPTPEQIERLRSLLPPPALIPAQGEPA